MKALLAVFLSATTVACLAAPPLPTVAPELRGEYILTKVAEAEERCRDEPLTLPQSPDPKGANNTWFIERPVLLCAYSEVNRTWHPVVVTIPSPVPREYFACIGAAQTVQDRKSCVMPYRIISDGYRLAHLGGTGATRLSFNVWHQATGERLTVYRTRHLWLDDDALKSRDITRVIATMRTISYTPYHADLYDPALVVEGKEFLYRAVERSLAEMTHVPSNAFPDRTLSKSVPWEIPMALAIIEQMDDKAFEELPTVTTEAVFVEYALNRERTFMWTQSSAMAIGPMQFTNGNGNGTYSSVVARCPEAKLNPNFDVGARELTNSIKAAICLIDLEVAQFPRIAKLFERSPILAGIYPVAAYNGSPASARALYDWVLRRGIDIEADAVAVPDALHMKRHESCPCRLANGKLRKKGTRLVIKQNTETPGYIKKYIFVINYLSKE